MRTHVLLHNSITRRAAKKTPKREGNFLLPLLISVAATQDWGRKRQAARRKRRVIHFVSEASKYNGNNEILIKRINLEKGATLARSRIMYVCVV